MNTVIERMQEPTPKFFQKLRNTALTLAAIGASLMAAPIALPAFIIKLAGYLTVAGAVATTVSQAAVKSDQ